MRFSLWCSVCARDHRFANTKLGVAKRVAGIIGFCQGARARRGPRGGGRRRVLSLSHVTPTSTVCEPTLRSADARRYILAKIAVVRELDERLRLERLITDDLSDSRHGMNTQFRVADFLRQSVYTRLAGYEDLNDAVRRSTDPTFRLIASACSTRFASRPTRIWNGKSLTCCSDLPGRPSHKQLVWYKSFHYQAGSWTHPRGVVAKVEHHAGERFPRVGLIVTPSQKTTPQRCPSSVGRLGWSGVHSTLGPRVS